MKNLPTSANQWNNFQMFLQMLDLSLYNSEMTVFECGCGMCAASEHGIWNFCPYKYFSFAKYQSDFSSTKNNQKLNDLISPPTILQLIFGVIPIISEKMGIHPTSSISPINQISYFHSEFFTNPHSNIQYKKLDGTADWKNYNISRIVKKLRPEKTSTRGIHHGFVPRAPHTDFLHIIHHHSSSYLEFIVTS